MALEPTQFEGCDYGTAGWSSIVTSNFQKANDYWKKIWITQTNNEDGKLIRYDASNNKWVVTTFVESDVINAINHTGRTDNPHNVTKDQVGLGNVENILSKYDATSDPTPNDDSSQGYSVGSFWFNTNTGNLFVCVDATEGSAVWQKLWHNNNDGSGSGLDADKLDGNDSSYYTDSSNIDYDNSSSGLSSTNVQDAIDEVKSKIDDIEDGTTTVSNADKVDGFHASQTPQANTIPVSDSNGKLTRKWIKIVKKTITSDYTTDDDDQYLFVDASSGNITITLTTTEDQEVVIKKTDSSSNTVTITPSSGNIEGQSSLTLSSQYEYCRVFCDGTDWWKV